jgi:hypothetical protein
MRIHYFQVKKVKDVYTHFLPRVLFLWIIFFLFLGSVMAQSLSDLRSLKVDNLSDAQIEQFVSLMDKHHAAREAVVVHCVAGCGRTGQFIVAWCAKAGFIPEGTDPVQWIRARRKCCLETSEQTNCAKRLMNKYR